MRKREKMKLKKKKLKKNTRYTLQSFLKIILVNIQKRIQKFKHISDKTKEI